MTGGFAHLLVVREPGVVWITLNRPAEANALNQRLADEFLAVIREAEADEGCHVVVIAGSGRFFCAGGDVVGMIAADDPSGSLATLAATMHEALLTLAQSRLVTVASVHGPAVGAGLGLVLNADFVLASSGASFLSAYVGVGLTPDCGVSYLLPRVIGPRRAARMLLAGYTLTAEEALEWGIVTELVDDEGLEARTRELSIQLANSATPALGLTRQLMRREGVAGYAGHLRQEEATIATMVAHPDTQRRLVSFVNRARNTAHDITKS